MIRLRHVSAVNPPTPEFDRLRDDAMIPFVPLEAVWPSGLDSSRRKAKGDASTGYTRFIEGDIVVPKITPTFQADRTTIATGLDGGVAAGTTELHVVRPGPSTERRYIRYLLSSSPFLKGGEAEMIGVAGQKRVPDAWLRDFRVPVTDVAEQRAIADFLDAETARIDALITKKRRLIELLDERFEAAVFHSITRGLRAGVPMKPSGLSWVEEIPQAWGTPTVSANFELQLGKMLNADAASGPKQYPYLRNVNVQWDRLDLTDLATMHFDDGDRRRCELRRGDVLVCEGGEVGRAAVWRGDLAHCYYQKAIHRVRPRRGANGRYLMYCLRAAAKRSVFAVEGNLSTIVHLTGEQLRVHRFPWPSDEEQAEIVKHLDEAASRTREAYSRVSRQIDLLVEHRQALITAAVTGELAIPGVAA